MDPKQAFLAEFKKATPQKQFEMIESINVVKRGRIEYVGWIYIGIDDAFHFKPNYDKDGNRVEMDLVCASDKDAIEQADKWFGQPIKLHETISKELGWRIYVEKV